LYETTLTPIVDYQHIIIDNLKRLPLAFIHTQCYDSREAMALAGRIERTDNPYAKRQLMGELAACIEENQTLFNRIRNRIKDAIELAVKHLGENVTKIAAMRDHLAKRILTEIPYTRLNGHPEQRLPGNVNVCFRFIEGEALLLSLDLMGIAGSSGSACTSGSLDPSHVLLAIGLPHEIAHGSLRLSLSEENTMEEVDYVVEALKKIVERLRAMSPLYDEFCKAQEG